MMGNFTLANNQNTRISVKIHKDTSRFVMKQPPLECLKSGKDAGMKFIDKDSPSSLKVNFCVSCLLIDAAIERL